MSTHAAHTAQGRQDAGGPAGKMPALPADPHAHHHPPAATPAPAPAAADPHAGHTAHGRRDGGGPAAETAARPVPSDPKAILEPDPFDAPAPISQQEAEKARPHP